MDPYKKKIAVLLLASAGCLILAPRAVRAQAPVNPPNNQTNLQAQQLTLLPQNPVAPVIYFQSQPSLGGSTTWYYWFVSHDAAGNAGAPAGPFPSPFAAATISASYPIAIQWTVPAGVATVDVLRTATASPDPSGACNCAVVIGSAGATFSDIGTLLNYTVATSTSQNPLVLTNLFSGGATPGVVDPTAFPYLVKADAKSGADGSVTNTQNTLTSTNQSCSLTDVGKLAIVVSPSNGTYPFGTGLVTVTGCSGNSWTLSTTSSGTVSNENWAIGTDAGSGLASAYAAAEAANKILAVPCGAMIVAEPPFLSAASLNYVVQQPDIEGCASTAGSHFILHPQITSGVLTNGGAFFASFLQVASTGSLSLAGFGGNAKIENIWVSSLQGNLPGTSGKSFQMISGFFHVDNLYVSGLGITTGVLQTVLNTNGESHFHKLNIQHLTNPGGTNTWGAWVSGQGINIVDDSIFALSVGSAIACQNSNCVSSNNYITQTNGGVDCQAGPCTITYVGNQCSGMLVGSSGQGCLGDGGQATTFYVFGNPVTNTSSANYAAIQLTNAGSILDISGTNVSSTTAGYNISGVAGSQVNDRVGNTFSSTLAQFSGQYIPIGGGSTATNKSSGAANFGVGQGVSPIISSMIATSTLDIKVGVRQVTAGVGCGAGTNTASGTLSWTSGGAGQNTNITQLSISANGSVGSSTVYQSIPIHADIGTAVNFQMVSSLVSTGCSTVPQYTLDFSTI